MGTICVPVYVDNRKVNKNKGYVKGLQNYAAQLENSIIRMRETNNEEDRKKILNSVPINCVRIAVPQENLTLVPSAESSMKNQASSSYNNLAVPGTGAFSSDFLAVKKPRLAPENDKKCSTILEDYSTLTKSPYIILSLSLFFKWLYPSHYFFIYREALLSAFFQDRNLKSYYCSKELIYAVAALGSKISNKSGELYHSL